MTNAPIPVLLPVYKRADVTFERGEGAYLHATDGRRYLDFGAGIAVTSLGHAHPHLVRALTEQAGRLWHVSNLYRIAEQEALGERLVAHSFADTVFFTNSGAEALECAIKMVRRHHYERGEPRRYRIVTFEGAFHGRTMATISAGGQAKYLQGFRPGLEGFDQVPVGDLARLTAAIGEETAAVLIEPIQGESGIRVVPPDFLRELRRLCDEHGLLLIFDEVQCGMGRTGHLFAYQGIGVEPDVMALAKALGNGFPIGACLATAGAAAGLQPGTHGSTFGGNPLATAVGNAVLDVMLADGFLDRVRAMGEVLRGRLEELAGAYPKVVTGVRGRGLILGLALGPTNTEVSQRLMDRGLLTVPAGDNVIRILPPLTVERPQIDEAVEILDGACRELAA
ncbi:MAG TPA: aspartate aminotransferase family protein [Geminicoccaceae bacterium]|nr:aspartate aminotransferase family protein [Geminicoccaceae bacterium]